MTPDRAVSPLGGASDGLPGDLLVQADGCLIGVVDSAPLRMTAVVLAVRAHPLDADRPVEAGPELLPSALRVT